MTVILNAQTEISMGVRQQREPAHTGDVRLLALPGPLLRPQPPRCLRPVQRAQVLRLAAVARRVPAAGHLLAEHRRREPALGGGSLVGLHPRRGSPPARAGHRLQLPPPRLPVAVTDTGGAVHVVQGVWLPVPRAHPGGGRRVRELHGRLLLAPVHPNGLRIPAVPVGAPYRGSGMELAGGNHDGHYQADLGGQRHREMAG
jgi:hypothetical protein